MIPLGRRGTCQLTFFLTFPLIPLFFPRSICAPASPVIAPDRWSTTLRDASPPVWTDTVVPKREWREDELRRWVWCLRFSVSSSEVNESRTAWDGGERGCVSSGQGRRREGEGSDGLLVLCEIARSDPSEDELERVEHEHVERVEVLGLRRRRERQQQRQEV